MSWDLAVWGPGDPMSAAEAQARYARLCEGDTSAVAPHPDIEQFYRELTARWPELDDVPDERIDDCQYCPWSCEIDRSAGHVVASCVLPMAGKVSRVVRDLAAKHGLVVYDPQDGALWPPSDAPAQGGRPWWRFW